MQPCVLCRPYKVVVKLKVISFKTLIFKPKISILIIIIIITIINENDNVDGDNNDAEALYSCSNPHGRGWK